LQLLDELKNDAAKYDILDFTPPVREMGELTFYICHQIIMDAIAGLFNFDHSQGLALAPLRNLDTDRPGRLT
jgi:hypothetical protein